MPIDEAYAQHHVEFEIDGIAYEDDATATPNPITFEYAAPAISVDASGRFAVHEIIGGATVRQKIGEDPLEVGVSGVCKESTARDIDSLRDATHGTIYTNRLTGGQLTVQFASSSTAPMSDGGAVDFSDQDQEFLYTFDLECVEIEFVGGSGGSGGGGGTTGGSGGSSPEPGQIQ